MLTMAVDVARAGVEVTTLTVRDGERVVYTETCPWHSVAMVTDQARTVFARFSPRAVTVVGVGIAGVIAQTLRELHLPVELVTART